MKSLASFIASHGFTPIYLSGAIAFDVPFRTIDGATGSERMTVRTMSETRIALGY